jgi:hypothetical protein
VCLHPSLSLNNEKICCEDKIAVCEKTAGLRCRKFSDLNYVCSKVLVRVKIFEFQDILNENRFLSTFRGHSKRPISAKCRAYDTSNQTTSFPGLQCDDEARHEEALVLAGHVSTPKMAVFDSYSSRSGEIFFNS